MGNPGIIHGHTPECHMVSWSWMHAWKTSTTERSFVLQAMWVIYVLGFNFDMLSTNVCYDQALEEVRSTGAGIKCLYCTCTGDSHAPLT